MPRETGRMVQSGENGAKLMETAMNKFPVLIAGGLALATAMAATAARAEDGQGQGGWIRPPQTAYYPPAVKAPGDQTVAAAIGTVPEQDVVVYAGQGWQVEPAVPVYSPGNVDHDPQTGRGGLENNTAG